MDREKSINKYEINYKNVLKNILLKEEEKFFHGLSFIITSLIALHIVIYFNFPI